MNVNKTNELLGEIVHLAGAAITIDDEAAKRIALGDIYAAIASVLPVDHGTDVTPPEDAAVARSEKQKAYFRRHFSFCDGLFPIRFSNTEELTTASCWIGGRRFTMDVIREDHSDGVCSCVASIKDNGDDVAAIRVNRGKGIGKDVVFAAFKAYVRNLGGSNRYKSRGGFLKQAAKRVEG